MILKNLSAEVFSLPLFFHSGINSSTQKIGALYTQLLHDQDHTCRDRRNTELK